VKVSPDNKPANNIKENISPQFISFPGKKNVVKKYFHFLSKIKIQ